MLNLPAEVTAFLAQFAPLFTPSVWYHAQVLVVGAILAPGKRTVTAILIYVAKLIVTPYYLQLVVFFAWDHCNIWYSS